MKLKRKLIIILTVIISILLICGIIIFITNTKKEKDEISIGQRLDNITKSEDLKKVEKELKSSVDNNEKINITKEMKEIYKVLNPSMQEEEIEKNTIQNIIFSTEAKKRNIELSQESLNEIKRISTSEEILKNVPNDDKDKIEQIVYKYLEDVEYNVELKKAIIQEIQNNSLSVDDYNLKTVVEEYNKLQENAKEISNEDEKKEAFKEIYAKFIDAQELYYELIMNTYNM